MGFLKKIQSQPIRVRKTILWTIVVILSLILLVFWVKNFQERLKSFRKEELKEKLPLPTLEEKLKSLPEIKIPEISEEEFKKMMDSNPPSTLTPPPITP